MNQDDSSDVRTRIVRAARHLVAEQGVHPSTMRGIARRAGVTTGAVTHYFADKADVMHAVITYNNTVIARRIAEGAAGKKGIAALEAVVDAVLPLDEEALRCWTVLIAFWGHAPAKEFVESEGSTLGYQGLRALVMAVLRDAIALEELPASVDVEHEAERMLALIGGIGLMVGGFPQHTAPIRARARRMIAEQIAGLTAG